MMEATAYVADMYKQDSLVKKASAVADKYAATEEAKPVNSKYKKSRTK